jgi:hypothetical protein
MQDPKRLQQACVERGVDADEFSTLYIGETLRQAAGTSGVPSEEKVENE